MIYVNYFIRIWPSEMRSLGTISMILKGFGEYFAVTLQHPYSRAVSDRIGVLRDHPNIYRVFFLPVQPNRSITEYFLWKIWPNRSRRIWTKIRLIRSITGYIRIIRNIFTSSLIKNICYNLMIDYHYINIYTI